MKRIVSLLIIFIVLFSNIASFADEPIIVDYIDYLHKFRKKYMEEYKKTFNTPTSIFKATIDGEEYIVKPFIYPYKEGEEQIKDPNLYEDDFKSVPVHITVPVGINSFIEKELDDVSSESIGFKINLAGTDESIDTIVDFYQDKTLIDSKHITVKESEEVYFNVDAARLKEGENNFYAVVNSNFDLTKAHPYGEENI